MEGKGRTKIRKEKIASIRRIERKPKKVPSTLKKESTQIEDKIFSYKKEMNKEMKRIFVEGIKETLPQIIIFILLGLFVFLSFFILIFKAPYRPLGVKLICFFEGISLFLTFLYLLMVSSLALNEVIYTLKGRFFYFIFVWALHLLLIISLFFLFHLRGWARRIYLICLGVFFVYNMLCIAFQKEFLKEYSQAMIKKRDVQEIKSEKLMFIPINKKEKFPWIEYFIRSGIYFLLFLYLLRPKTKEAFRQKIPVDKKKLAIITLTSLILFIVFDKTYQSFFVKLTGCPYLFVHPQRSRIKVGKILPSQNLIKYQALGFQFFLPPNFKKFEKACRSDSVVFIDMKTKEMFTLSKGFPYVHKWIVTVAYARYNPILLLLKQFLLLREDLNQ